MGSSWKKLCLEYRLIKNGPAALRACAKESTKVAKEKWILLLCVVLCHVLL